MRNQIRIVRPSIPIMRRVYHPVFSASVPLSAISAFGSLPFLLNFRLVRSRDPLLYSRRNFLQTATGCTAAVFSGLPFSRFLAPEEDKWAVRLAADPLRPQFHLLPAHNWMNDPNGPIFWNGRYHMFFQYNPDAAVWGDIHWAHAISPDMIYWKHLPIALAPTRGGPDQDGCFSGSAVKDGDIATFVYTGVKTVPPAEATLRDGTHNFRETQCLATSTDPLLKTWNKLPASVLLPPNDPKLTGFRDPFLWRSDRAWYMGVGSGQKGLGGSVLLYRSPDLRHWEYLHPLASGKSNGKRTSDFVDSGEMWECPDFFQLGKKHVLLYSTERKVYWQTGELDPKELSFHPEKDGYQDFGAFYAPKSQQDATGRRILWGWITETRPEAEFSAAGWAGCMSLPRVLSLNDENILQMKFLPELSKLRETEFSLDLPRELARPSQAIEAFTRKISLPGACAECEITIPRKKFALSFVSGDDPWLEISFDPQSVGQELRVGDKSVGIPITTNGSHQIHLFFDASVVECIVDHTIAVTTRNYTIPRSNLRILLSDTNMSNFSSLKIYKLKPISKDRLTADSYL
jgi:beta-fructofuranosidase